LSRVARSNKINLPNLAIIQFQKGLILKNKKRPFKKIFVKITSFKVRSSGNITSFAQMFPKQALKYTNFISIQKCPNPFISGK